MKKNAKHIFSALLFLGFLFMAVGSDDDKKEEEISFEANNSTLNLKDEKQTETEIIEQLQREINSIEKGIDFSQYKESVESIQLEVALFLVWGNKINEALSSENKEINELGNRLKAKVEKIQKDEYPKLRKAYGKIVAKNLWVENIEVEVFGNNSKTIQFTSGIFANNKNKQETQNTLSEILNLLRFNRVNYKWYKYDDEYTYYELNTLKDNEISEY